MIADEGTRDCRFPCTKSEAASRRTGPKTWCKGNERSRLCGFPCTNSGAISRRTGPKTWYKGNERTRFCGSLCTKSEAGRATSSRNLIPEILRSARLRPGTLVSRNERSRCISAQRLLPYIMLFLGLQVQRRSPRRPAAPRRPGSASPSPAKPSPHRRSLLIGEACASRVYIGRRGMRTVKVVPLPGMLSTWIVA